MESVTTKIRNPAVMAEFRKRRTRQWIASGISIAVVLPVFLNRNKGLSVFGLPENFVVGIMVTFVAGLLIFSLLNWRCPQCKRYFGKRWNPQFCPRCGVQLHD
jgi:hypothetical protein